jgi:hypothetical protein
LNRLHSDGEYLCATLQDGPTIYIFRVSDLEKGNLNPWKEVIRDYTKPNPLPLNLPSHAITFNGKFAIANTVNNSVYLWNNVEDAGDVNKVIVLGQQSISGINPGLGQNRLFWPASLAMYRNHLWVGEFKFSSRILSFSYSDPTEINEVESIPAEFMLYQNYPNPFHSATTIQYQLPEATDISIKIYNMTGKEVYTLVKDSEPSGIHEIIWDGRNYSGQQLPGGVYFCTISTNKFFRPMKMILMR